MEQKEDENEDGRQKMTKYRLQKTKMETEDGAGILLWNINKKKWRQNRKMEEDGIERWKIKTDEED